MTRMRISIPAFHDSGNFFRKTPDGDGFIGGSPVYGLPFRVKALHFFSGVRKGTVIGRNQGCGVPVEPEKAAVLFQGFHILRAEHGTGRDLTISTVVDFELRADGMSIPWSQGAALAAEPALDGTITTGRMAEGEVGWEVPAGWQSIELRYFPDGRGAAPLVFRFSRSDLSW